MMQRISSALTLTVKQWLDGLKDVVYGVEDLLDEIASKVQRYKIEAESQKGGMLTRNGCHPMMQTAVTDVLVILGLGGLRKTPLAQHVYSRGKVYGCFDKKHWICIS